MSVRVSNHLLLQRVIKMVLEYRYTCFNMGKGSATRTLWLFLFSYRLTTCVPFRFVE